MSLYKLNKKIPKIDTSVYIASSAIVCGNVIVGKHSSIWFNCVIRGDADQISIGENSNIQDISMLHVDYGKPLFIGNNVTVGHRCIIHGCTIKDSCLIGMGSIIMNGAIIGKGSIIAAGSVILENTVIPENSLAAGIPGKIKNVKNRKIFNKIAGASEFYKKEAVMYKNNLIQIKKKE